MQGTDGPRTERSFPHVRAPKQFAFGAIETIRRAFGAKKFPECFVALWLTVFQVFLVPLATAVALVPADSSIYRNSCLIRPISLQVQIPLLLL